MAGKRTGNRAAAASIPAKSRPRRAPTRNGDAPASASASACATHAADAPLRTPLESIELLCQGILADCDDRPEEFAAQVEEIRAAARDGLAIVQRHALCLLATPLPEGVVKDLGEELPHKILKVYYRCDELLKRDADWYGPFQDSLADILKSYQQCRTAIRDLLAAPPRQAIENTGQATSTAFRSAPAVAAAPAAPAVRAHTVGRVLVVDDDSESRQRLIDLLQAQCHTVDSVTSGRDALAHLDKHPCDLVVLDLCMEGVDGAAVLREMREDYALRAVPVIVVSAAQDVGSAIRCIELGADDFLTKPIEHALLRARVVSCLDKGAMRRNDRELHEQLRQAKADLDNLLYKVFPYTVAQELRSGARVQPRGCDNVAVLFCDLVGFTSFCAGKPATVVVEHLDELFAAFEAAADKPRVEKIKTIGDCFLVTAGVLGRFDNPVLACLQAAEGMRRAAAESDPQWQVRIGIHVGPVVAGMVGRQQFAFDVWGDTVNTAARIQTAADPGMIALSEPAWAQIFELCRGKSIGPKALKGKSDMEVFRFDGFRAPATA